MKATHYLRLRKPLLIKSCVNSDDVLLSDMSYYPIVKELDDRIIILYFNEYYYVSKDNFNSYNIINLYMYYQLMYQNLINFFIYEQNRSIRGY